MRAVKLLRPHKSNNAGEVCGFPDAEAAALVASGAALYHGAATAPSSSLEPSREALLAGFAQRGIDVDPASSDSDLRLQALSVMATERAERAARSLEGGADEHQEEGEGMDGTGGEHEETEGGEDGTEGEPPAAKGEGQPATGRVGSPRRARSA